jgi:uncharacterized protein (DUF952 family)
MELNFLAIFILISNLVTASEAVQPNLFHDSGSKSYMNQNNHQETTPPFLFLIVAKDAWEKSLEDNKLLLSSHHDLFIHLAKEDQVPHIIEKFWADKECVLLKIDSQQMTGRLIYEKNPGGSNRYYHLYDGTIPMHAIVDTSICPL